ncbi:hypothetical protein C3F09_09505 [candidate division GN15 bacterium]|uniref:Phosphatidylglycerol lysyltransferase n=1 Tax=candidate division GN15 bacterium TaxID=2072418 RepID=A0A855WYZ8_9BACT|nr:MAG: hypothetical protein C3F09_09505 [candidate division GN15 bacterium]
MAKRTAEILGSLLGIGLFIAALWILSRALSAHHLRDVMASVHQVPAGRILLALGFTLLSYFALTCYDWLGFRYLGRSLTYWKVVFTAFTTYSVSHNLGFSLFTGGSIRYRLYSAWGVTALEIAQLVGFSVVTFWLGYSALAAVILLSGQINLPDQIHMPVHSTFVIGLIFLIALVGYVVFNFTRKSPLTIRGMEIALPKPRITAAQIIVSSFDWCVAAAALYVLLPDAPGLGFDDVLGVFLVAQLAGLSSNVPGGLGVFESVCVLLLQPYLPAPVVLGSVLVYRVVYYLIPLGIAALSLGSYEAARHRAFVRRLSAPIGQWIGPIAPQVLAFFTFLCGAVLLVSGATPALTARLKWLYDFLPLAFIEASHFINSLIGIGLLIISRGLQRRVDGAWVLSVLFLAIGIVVSLAKGGDYEEALVLAIILVLLVPSRGLFYRKSSLFSEPLNPMWLASVALVLITVAWLTFFSYKHVDYSNDLWWRFALVENAPRSLRALVGALVALSAFAVLRLMRPHPHEPTLPTGEDLDRLLPVIASARETEANLALLGDKTLIVSQSGKSFLMYGVEGRSWVAMGDPIGIPAECRDLVWQFHTLADRNGGWTVFYQVDPANLPCYLDMGLSLTKLGEEARINLTHFTLEGHEAKPMRHWHRKPESEGCSFEIIPQAEVSRYLPEFRSISDQWLQLKNVREKRFSLGYFDERYLGRFPHAIVRQNGRIVAFANIWPGGGKEELSIDLMRHTPEAHGGVMDFLFIELMLWGKQQGYQWFNMGMAPFSGLDNRGPAPLWHRLGALVYRYGEYFYNFQGLRRYKEKFHPVWTPRYLASPGGVSLFRILANLGTLISGGAKGVVAR